MSGGFNFGLRISDCGLKDPYNVFKSAIRNPKLLDFVGDDEGMTIPAREIGVGLRIVRKALGV